MTAIAVDNLQKVFGRGKNRVVAVDSLSFEVQPGQVYGFLGHNGAGKSTTIRMLMDLIRPTAGSATIFGQSVQDDKTVLRDRVGALVEGASFYPFMTGRESLEVFARTSGCYNPARIDKLLDLVGMADRADRKTKGYSTGMKQRVGIAAALLNNPDLVILDEPTSGLDPRGIQDIRRLIRRLVDEQGKTVFLSSHMLHEVEQVCDRVAVIHKGRLISEGSVSELLSAGQMLTIEAEPLNQAEAVLAEAFTVQRSTSDENTGTPQPARLQVHATREDTPRIVQMLTQQDIALYSLTRTQRTLESYFLDITSDSAETQTADTGEAS
jgi:ABC-2 type transport system ATP-binding protein